MASADGRPFFTRIESFRGLGAMAVAGYHMSGGTVHGLPLLPHTPWEGVEPLQNALGRFAIALLPGHPALMSFFVISGFVLRVSLAYGPQSISAASAKFLLSRAFRIYPIVFLGVALLACFPWARVGSDVTVLSPGELVANLFLVETTLNGAYWALQVEVLMAPLIVALYFLERRFGTRALIAIAVATTGLAFWPRWAYWPPLSTTLFAFVLGMALPTQGRRFATGLPGHAAVLWAAGSIVVLLVTGPLMGTYSRWTSVIEAYAATVFLSLTAYRSDLAVSRWLDAKPLRLLGRASGSYYVLHMATVMPALWVAAQVLPPDWAQGVPAAVGFAVVAVWLVAIAPLMVCSFTLVEAPGIALGRRLCRRLGLESERTAPAVEVEPPRRLAA